jgi:pimeloyl-ACP methyl ester carboxylesterase
MNRTFLSILALALVGISIMAITANHIILTGGNLSAADRLAIDTMEPDLPFGKMAPPKAPRYRSLDSWAAHPAVKGYAYMAPPNTAYPEAQGSASADVFFIHPTTSTSSEYWNVPINDREAVDGVSIVMAEYASVFNAAARVYAPRYRQATLYSFFDDESASGIRALKLAYADVERSFNYYIKHFNKGRPFILAGHSQGSIHAYRLLQTRIIGTPLAKRLVAAYLIGGTILKDTPGIEASRSPDDIGTLIGWNTYSIEGDPDFFTQSGITWIKGAYSRVGSRPVIQVNPLSWKLGGALVAAGANPGSLPIINEDSPQDRLPMLIPGVTGADASNGIVLIEKPNVQGFDSEDEGISIFNTNYGDYHNFDYLLFYESIRKNAIDRVASFVNGRRSGKTGSGRYRP